MNILNHVSCRYQAALNKTLTEAIDAIADKTLSSALSATERKIKSLIGYDIYFNEDDDYDRINSILMALDRKKFLAHAYHYGGRRDFYASSKLRKDITYIINLNPRLNAFIMVSTRATGDYLNISVSCDELNLFFFGKEARKACKLFLNSYNPTPKYTPSDEEEELLVTLYSIDLEPGCGDTRISRLGAVRAKTFDQLYMPAASKDHIITYLTQWTNAVKLFSSYGIPYKAGILLYGPPGTGKSTLAKTIGATFGLNVYVVNMGTFTPAMVTTIQGLCRNTVKTIVVLLEDIDYIFGKRKQDRTPEEKANGNAILQLLDGVNDISNVIFIATTNDIDSLDEAIRREGRFDIQVHVDNINKEIATQMITGMGIQEEAAFTKILSNEEFPINPAHLQNKVVHYVFDQLREDDAKMSGEANEQERQ